MSCEKCTESDNAVLAGHDVLYETQSPVELPVVSCEMLVDTMRCVRGPQSE